MCNKLLSYILTHREISQGDIKYTQYELILTSLSDEQVLINTDRRHCEKI